MAQAKAKALNKACDILLNRPLIDTDQSSKVPTFGQFIQEMLKLKKRSDGNLYFLKLNGTEGYGYIVLTEQLFKSLQEGGTINNDSLVLFEQAMVDEEDVVYQSNDDIDDPNINYYNPDEAKDNNKPNKEDNDDNKSNK